MVQVPSEGNASRSTSGTQVVRCPPAEQRAKQLDVLEKLESMRVALDEAISAQRRMLAETAVTMPPLTEPEPPVSIGRAAQILGVDKGAVTQRCRRAVKRGIVGVAEKRGGQWAVRLDQMAKSAPPTASPHVFADQCTALVEGARPAPVGQSDGHSREAGILTIASRELGVDLPAPLHPLQICNAHIEPRSQFARVDDPIALVTEHELHGVAIQQLGSRCGAKRDSSTGRRPIGKKVSGSHPVQASEILCPYVCAWSQDSRRDGGIEPD